MAAHLNHVAVAAPRNATADHTVSPASGTAVAGTAFTPTAGRLLVVVVEGSVTSTTPTGWTLPTGGSAVNNTGLYVWWRLAAGGDTLTTTHNASNYPAIFHFFEFEQGSAFSSAASAIDVASGGAGPSLSGLTGTPWVAAVVGMGGSTTDRTFTWDAGTELADHYQVRAESTDGYAYSLTYVAAYGSATWLSAATLNAAGLSLERLVFAVADPTYAFASAMFDPDMFWTSTPPGGGSRVSSDLAMSWNVGQRVSDDLVLSWSVGQRTSDDLVLSWSVGQRVSDDLVLSWSVGQRTSDDLALSWSVRQRVSDDLPLSWDVSSATRASADLALSWGVRQRVSDDLTLAWGVRTRSAAELPLAWAVRVRVSVSLVLSWAVGAAERRDITVLVTVGAQRVVTVTEAAQRVVSVTLPEGDPLVRLDPHGREYYKLRIAVTPPLPGAVVSVSFDQCATWVLGEPFVPAVGEEGAGESGWYRWWLSGPNGAGGGATTVAAGRLHPRIRVADTQEDVIRELPTLAVVH